MSGIGSFSEGTNSLLYAFQGEKGEAALAALSAIPGIKAVKVLKDGIQYLKIIPESGEAGKALKELYDVEKTAGNTGHVIERSGNAVKIAEQLSQESVIDKLDRYLLNPEHPVGSSKAKWFEQALGFTKENSVDLAKQVVFNPKTAVETATTEFGVKYNQTITIDGANGKTIDVVFVWIKNNDGVVRLVTSVPTKK
ncbi:DUF6883 domain-containing protein [Pectinatus frisingensis]|uniref:DUF6883 domain-containing protein n=1 Tax=Pectinatus frisingensis TaxID=865 RepID=UPI002EDB9E74